MTTIKGSCIVCPCSPWEGEILHLDEMLTNTVYSCDTQSRHVSRHGTRSCKATVQDHDYIACISYKTQFKNRLQTWEGAAVDSQLANSWLPRTCMQGLRARVCCMTSGVVDLSDSTIAINMILRVNKRHTYMLCRCHVAKQSMSAAVVSQRALSWFPRTDMLDL